MCLFDDAEPCTWLGTDNRKARKAHKCAECRREIAPGERYAYTRYIADGDLQDNKACAHCDAARVWLSKHCGGWVTEALGEELEEHFDSGFRVDGLPRLLVGFRRQWRGFASGLMPLPVIELPAC